MTRRAPKNPHLKTLEQALAARFGWQPGAMREALVAAITSKAGRLGFDEVSYCRVAAASNGEAPRSDVFKSSASMWVSGSVMVALF